ncbi:MAG: hypothetical protein IPF73_14290 [Betaproteobacteria bacterium]|nr:hypothetical protein [Betaproteobacteria bacterium]
MATGSLAALAVILVAAGAIAGSRRRDAIAAAWSREGWRAEAVFAVLYAAAIALRVSNPDLWTPGTAARSRWISRS